MEQCASCGDTESDLQACAGCGLLFCYECIEWCHDEDDEPNGDWYCENC